MGPIGCPETSARIYHYMLRNNPEERRSQTTPTFCISVLIRSADEKESIQRRYKVYCTFLPICTVRSVVSVVHVLRHSPCMQFEAS
jgi:hypothetical protein